MRCSRTGIAAVSIVLALVAIPSQSHGANRAAPLYVLGERATYQSGCFSPCLCPVLEAALVRGTFRLTPTGFDGLFDTFAVNDVNWRANVNGVELLIGGSGKYKLGGEVALSEQLELDLVVAGNPVQHFDSGLLAAGTVEFPAINVAVSMNHMFCHDTVIIVDAAPVRLAAMRRYRLIEPSTFQQGCVPPCACPTGPELPVWGTLSLLPLSPGPTFDEFAVLNVSLWVVSPGAPGRPGVTWINGAGIYEVGGELAREERLALDLVVGAQGVMHFDSGVIPGGGDFPTRVDVPISTSGTCSETTIDVHAMQVPSSTMPGAGR